MADNSTLAQDALDEQELVTRFSHFLKDHDGDGEYVERMQSMVETGDRRLLVDMDDLRRFDSEMTARLLKEPLPYIQAFERALKETIIGEFPEKEMQENEMFKVGFTGSFGGHQLSPRALLAHCLGNLVCVEGIVTKLSLVKPKLVRSVHYCPETNQSTTRDYKDAYSLDGLPTPMAIPSKDEEGRALQMEFGLSTYLDFQTMHIQEMPERAPLGQLPRSVEVVMEGDLVDKCKPGDRVQVVGLYRAVVFGQAAGFRTVVFANSIQSIGKDIQSVVMTPDDLQNIRKVAKQPLAFDTLSRSLAPSIYGHEYIKKALLLLLLGGMEKNLDNGTHLRGDVNILMVGDPSTAKSQLLRFVLGIAPLAISTTGRGSSGVGLTAAVTSDPETNERRLEAGAMVLADRGVVCIDEFDKMGDADRVAIHEVMEQQTVTIAKAGIHASLNARCSVVAAANPIYGAYDKDSSPQKNVGLPDSLLSRFDLLFIVLDNLNPDHDRAISDHILRMHRYERPGHQGIPFSANSLRSAAETVDQQEGHREGQGSAVYQKFNPLLHGAIPLNADGQREDILSTVFLRKFIHYAKSRIRPTLTEEAQHFITEEYAKLRQEQETKTLPVTARQLETMIRLASAHAKVRLSNKVEQIDCEQAVEIMRFALYHDTVVSGAHESAMNKTAAPAPNSETANANKRPRDDQDEVDDSPDSNTKQTKMDVDDPAPLSDISAKVNNQGAGAQSVAKTKLGGSGNQRASRFQLTVSSLFQTTRKDSLSVTDVLEEANKRLDAEQSSGSAMDEEMYSFADCDKLLKQLDTDGKIMFANDTVYKL